MLSSRASRADIESLLRTKKLDGTLTSETPWREQVSDDRAATGLPALDAELGGGFRRGHVSEVIGARSSGRTTVMCRTLAAAASRGELVALVDTSDRFDSASAASAGLDLDRLLWVRDTGDASRALKAFYLVLQAGGFGIVAFDLADVPAPVVRAFPFTTWRRVARVIEGTQTVALLVGSERIARSPGGVTVAFEMPGGSSAAEWAGASARSRLLTGITLRPRVVRAS